MNPQKNYQAATRSTILRKTQKNQITSLEHLKSSKIRKKTLDLLTVGRFNHNLKLNNKIKK